MSDPGNIAELQAKVDAARAAREARESKREDAARLQRLTDELEAEERAAANLDVIEGVEKDHGVEGKTWRRVNTGAGMIIVKRPHIATFRKYQDKGKTDSASLDALVRPCLLHPTKAEFDRIVNEEPAALMRAANAVCYLAGVRREDTAGE